MATTTEITPMAEERVELLRALRRRMHRMSAQLERGRAHVAAEGARRVARAFEAAAEVAFDSQSEITDCLRADGGFPRTLDHVPDLDSSLGPQESVVAHVHAAVAMIQADQKAIEDILERALVWPLPTRRALRDVDLRLDQARRDLRDSLSRPNPPS